MATNTGNGHRIGSVRDRSQVLNPRTEQYVERDRTNGQFVRTKSDGKPYKGVAEEPDRRRDK